MTVNQAPTDSHTFFLEESPTPIYQRIINSFRDALVRLGHRVILANPQQFTSYQDYLQYLRSQSIEYCLLTNPPCILNSYLEEESQFLFELTDCSIIFIHHNNFYNYSVDDICQKLSAFQRVKERSLHFCLEYSNFLDLRSIGLEHVYSIYHASEFDRLLFPESYCYDVSFVGHLLPGLSDSLESLPFSHRLQADYWQRLVKLDTKLEPSAITFAEQHFPKKSHSSIDFVAMKYFYISALHSCSQEFRGEVVKRIQAAQIDVIGGDPAYLAGSELNRKILKQHIKYHPSVENYAETRSIYASSKINLNITSLQFDQAVINRVIDVAAAGGFVLTDWKADLGKITSVAQEISYRTIEELNYKIDYYLHPDHERARLEIADALHQDIKRCCTYDSVVEFMLSKLHTTMSNSPSEVLQIDLGCGSHKPEGFIGVDVVAAPGVDVVADLNQRFPFADSSVDRIRAFDVVEHLPDRIHTMNEIWRICKPEALVHIRVPSTDGRGAFQDPTHVSFWNHNSFMYYCVEFPEYLKLCGSYGFQGAFSLVEISEEVSNNHVIHVNALLKVVKPIAQASIGQHTHRFAASSEQAPWNSSSKPYRDEALLTPTPDQHLRILVITNLYPPYVLGGYERSIADFSRLLQHRGHQVRVLTTADEQAFSSDHTSPCAEPEVYRCFSLIGKWNLHQGAEWFSPEQVATINQQNSQILAQHLQTFQPEVCLVGNLDLVSPEIVYQLLDAEIPVAHYVMNRRPGYSVDLSPHSCLYRYLTCSNWVAQALQTEGYPAETAITVYPGAAVEEFYQLALPPHDYLRIAYASLVMHYKGPDVLIEALSLLQAAGIEFTATIAGGTLMPKYLEALQSFVESEGLQDRIKFVGVLSRQKLSELYKTHNVLVFPSRFEEPFGISQIEAMAAGLTLVTSGTGGAKEIVQQGEDGLLFESENPLDLADILSYLPAHPDEWEAITRKGQQKAMTQFSQTKAVETLESILQGLAKQ